MKCYTCKLDRPREVFEGSQSKQCVDCRQRQSKTCPDCSTDYPIDEFRYKTGDRLYGYCRECRRARGRKYDARRRDSEESKYQRMMDSRKRDNSKNSKAWREKNGSTPYVPRRFDEVKGLASRQNQRAGRFESAGKLREQDVKWAWESSGQVCACNPEHELSDDNSISLDHVVPLKRGGWNCVHNIQFLCKRCNMRKGVSEIDFRTTEFVELLDKNYPECGVAIGRDYCRTEFEIRRGFLKGRPDWQEDS